MMTDKSNPREPITSLPRRIIPGLFSEPLRPGSPCPHCGEGKLDFNGLLDLECPLCGHTEPGQAGCT